MRRSIHTIAFLLLLVAQPITAKAQFTDTDLIDLGLENAWISQARVPFDGRGIVSSDLWLDQTSTRKFAVVDMPGYPLVRVAADRLDAKNRPIGLEKAKAEAQSIAAKLIGKPSGFEVAEVNIPQMRLVVVTATGLVQNFDAETGKLMWATPCGPLNTHAIPAAFSSQGVLVLQGDSLYLLDWLTGKQILTKHLPSSTNSSVAVIDAEIEPPTGTQRVVRKNSMALVSDFTGSIAAYGLTEKLNPWSGRLISRTEVRPVSSPDRKTLAIATSNGMVYIYSGSTQPQVQFRYENSSGVSGSLAAGKDAFYVGNKEGALSKISFDGKLRWNFNLSHPIATPALVDEEFGLVYLSSESGEFTAVNATTGFEAWKNSIRSNIYQPIAIAGANVICTTSDNGLVAIDRKTGQVRGKARSKSPLPVPAVNHVSDRVYVANDRGQIQCLRPIGKDLPRIINPVEGPVKKKPVESQSTDENVMTRDSSDSADPFGGEGADGSSDGKPSGGDPFGADPFAGGNP